MKKTNYLSMIIDSLKKSPDVWIMSFILLAANIHIFTGYFNYNLFWIFTPDDFKLHRIIFHPFVHISWYHLLLDAGAFFLLYTGLKEKRMGIKILYLVVCSAFSLAFAMHFSSMIENLGLCGLSGVAHGLMAISGLEMLEDKETQMLGCVSLAAVIIKSVYELITGNVLLEFLQLGMCGTPIAACHTGGVAGGIFIYFSIRFLSSINIFHANQANA
ncbi:rhomboid family intramembrane serine protease [Desulfobacterales bacterium HSG17]|nr:rhomboid family intramembrane serine protease [Desulfobacterales bacterium HSG17]